MTKFALTVRTVVTGLFTILLLTRVVTAEDSTPTSSSKIMKGVRQITFVGESGTAWSDWVIKTLEANGYPNLIQQDAGVGRDDAAKLLTRFQHDVLDFKPDLIVLSMGSGDREPVEEFQINVEEVFKQVRQTKAKILLCLPPGVSNQNKKHTDANDRLVPYIEVLRKLAQINNYPVVDIQAALTAGTADKKAMWGPHGWMPSTDGWRVIARAILSTLGCEAPLVEEENLFRISPMVDGQVKPVPDRKKVCDAFLKDIAQLKAQYESHGQLDEAIAVHKEWDRFSRQATLTSSDYVNLPLRLREMQVKYAALLMQPEPSSPPTPQPAQGIAVKPENNPPPSKPIENVSDKSLKLSPFWTRPFKTDFCTSELGLLLSDQAQSALSTNGDDSLMVFQDISFLMSQQKAETVLGKRLSSTVPLHCSAFPKESFSYSIAEGIYYFKFNNPISCSGDTRSKRRDRIVEPVIIGPVQYDKILLVTDYARQVVGVQLVEENPRGLSMLSDECFQEGYKIYDFVQSGTKSLPKMHIGHWVEGGNVIKIYSELVDKGTGRVKNRTLLLLPKSIADVILFSLQHYQE